MEPMKKYDFERIGKQKVYETLIQNIKNCAIELASCDKKSEEQEYLDVIVDDVRDAGGTPID